MIDERYDCDPNPSRRDIDIVDRLRAHPNYADYNEAADEIVTLRIEKRNQKNAYLFKLGDIWWVCTANDHGPFCRLCQRIVLPAEIASGPRQRELAEYDDTFQ